MSRRLPSAAHATECRRSPSVACHFRRRFPLDLLAAHAASALFAARVYSNTDRKLRTLESLVQLVRST